VTPRQRHVLRIEPTATRTERDGVALVKSLVRGTDGPAFRIELRSTRVDPVAVRFEDPFPGEVDPDTVHLVGETEGWARYPGAYAEYTCWLPPGDTVTTGYVLETTRLAVIKRFMHTPRLTVATAANVGLSPASLPARATRGSNPVPADDAPG